MSTLDDMTTLSQVMNSLRKKGVDKELTMTDHGKMICKASNEIYTPDELKIIKTFRFEGASDPSDNSALYLVLAPEDRMYYILDAYGVYSNHEGASFDEFLKQIPTEDQDLADIFHD